MTDSENHPLPILTDELQNEIALARAEAAVKLEEELDACWAACFPQDLPVSPALRTPAPDSFFKPFVSYGVTLYQAYAQALIKLAPDFLEYQAWMNFGLKTKLCQELTRFHLRPTRYIFSPASLCGFRNLS